MKKNKTAFLLASENGHKEILKILISRGVHLNETDEWLGSNALHLASSAFSRRHKETVELLRKYIL